MNRFNYLEFGIGVITGIVATIIAVVIILLITKKNRKQEPKIRIIHEPEIYDGNDNITVFEVAKYILTKNEKPMSAERLQMLCYFAQINTLLKYNKPLFTESFFRWQKGPVCTPLYVNTLKSSMVKNQDIDMTTENLSQMQKICIDEVMNSTKKTDTVTLTLFANDHNFLKTINIGDIINNDYIIDFYKNNTHILPF